MRFKLALLFLLITISAYSQDWLKKEYNYKLYMSIKEVIFDSTLVETQGEVIWGTDQGDTTCFIFDGEKMKCFYPIGKTLRRKAKYLRTSDIPKFIEKEYGDTPTENVFLRQDHYNELYIIRFSTLDEGPGLVIWITNYEYGTPSYILSWPSEDLVFFNQDK